MNSNYKHTTMKALSPLLLLSFFSFFSLISQAQLNGEFTEVTIPAPSLSNNLFNEPSSQDITIYLPPSYHEVDYAFPVVYFLEAWGCGHTAEAHLLGYDNRLSQENMEEMIVVMIEGCNTLLGAWFVNSDATGNWEDFVCYDVINYIDSHYRTIRKNQCRAIAGHSMGGHGALNLALKHPELFKNMYGLSPSIFKDIDIKPLLGFEEDSKIKDILDFLESLKDDNFESELNNLINSIPSSTQQVLVPLGIGAAFAPDTSGHVPFIQFPFSLDEKQQIVEDDSIMGIWIAGLGQWDKKIELYPENLTSYDTLIFSSVDNETILVDGVRYFHNILNRLNIENTIFNTSVQTYPNGHNDLTRLHIQMFPAFSATLWRDSSRFRSETEILAFELDNQILEAVIDPANGTIEAFISDTSSLEAISPHISLSDGAWETPMANQELDFSWGPIVFRVTSGDYQNNKLWTVTITQLSNSKIDNNELGAISIFPNPTLGVINITGLTAPAKIKIYNLQGQLLKSFQQDQNTIDISDLQPGVYFLNLTTEDKTLVRKVVRE